MKIVNTPLFRALVALAAGILMIQYRETMVKWLTVSVGVLFFLSGLIAIVFYYVQLNKAEKTISTLQLQAQPEMQDIMVDRPTFPIAAIGSIVVGGIFCFMPTTFVTYVSYILAAILIIGAIGEYILLINTLNTIKDYKQQLKTVEFEDGTTPVVPTCSIAYWLLPTILLLFGIIAIIRPMLIASAPFLFIGIAVVIYGLSELIHGIKFHTIRRTIKRELDSSVDDEQPEPDTTTETEENLTDAAFPEPAASEEADDQPAEDHADEPTHQHDETADDETEQM